MMYQNQMPTYVAKTDEELYPLMSKVMNSSRRESKNVTFETKNDGLSKKFTSKAPSGQRGSIVM